MTYTQMLAEVNETVGQLYMLRQDKSTITDGQARHLASLGIDSVEFAGIDRKHITALIGKGHKAVLMAFTSRAIAKDGYGKDVDWLMDYPEEEYTAVTETVTEVKKVPAPITQKQANKLMQLGMACEEIRGWTSYYAGKRLRELIANKKGK